MFGDTSAVQDQSTSLHLTSDLQQPVEERACRGVRKRVSAGRCMNHTCAGATMTKRVCDFLVTGDGDEVALVLLMWS